MTTWIVAFVVLAVALAVGSIGVLRRTQARVPDAPIVELATVPSDRGFWLRARLNETIGWGTPPAPSLDSLTLDPVEVVSALPQAIASSTTAPPVVPTPLAMPLSVTTPRPAPAVRVMPHSPFANQAVQNGKIGLMDTGSDSPEIAWHTPSAEPTSFSDPPPSSERENWHGNDGTISLNRPTPSSIAWSGPAD